MFSCVCEHVCVFVHVGTYAAQGWWGRVDGNLIHTQYTSSGYTSWRLKKTISSGFLDIFFPWCQIVHYIILVPYCLFDFVVPNSRFYYLGAKLTGCQIVQCRIVLRPSQQPERWPCHSPTQLINRLLSSVNLPKLIRKVTDDESLVFIVSLWLWFWCFWELQSPTITL